MFFRQKDFSRSLHWPFVLITVLDTGCSMVQSERHFCAFVRVIDILLRAGSGRFDLVVAPYNSGAVMVCLAKRVARARGLPFWPVLLMPVYTPYRFSGASSHTGIPYDNDALIPEFWLKLATLPSPVRSLLFIDDEIGNGHAFAACMTVIMRSSGQACASAHAPSACLIVAEEDGVHSTYAFPGLEVEFMPYATRPASTVSGVIFDLVDDSIQDAFREVSDGHLDKKQIASILFDLPVKTLVGNVPGVTWALNQEAERVVKNLPLLRADFGRYLDGLIASVSLAKKV